MSDVGVIHRGYRYRLAPTSEQAAHLEQFAGVCRLLYNLALEQRATWGRSHRLNYVQQCAELTRLRAEFDWIAAVPQAAQQQVLRDLDKAFANFFAGRARYPRPHKKGRHDSFRVPGRIVDTRRLSARYGEVRIPKVGWVRFRDTRPRSGRALNVTVCRDAVGWYVSFLCEVAHVAREPAADSVGVDVGVVTTLALSTGERMVLPTTVERLERRRRRAQKALARKRRGSRRYARQRERMARLSLRAVRIRRDFHHRAALDIARRFGVVVLEDIAIPGMTRSRAGTGARQKAGLNRVILSSAWGAFRTMLTYKLAERTGRLVTVPARFTSQTCAACGAVDARNRKSQAIFRCVTCGHVDHADINAAVNIERRWSTPSLDVEGCGRAPDEASTGESPRALKNLRPRAERMLIAAPAVLAC